MTKHEKAVLRSRIERAVGSAHAYAVNQHGADSRELRLSADRYLLGALAYILEDLLSDEFRLRPWAEPITRAEVPS